MDYTEYDTRLAAYAVIVAEDRVLLALWNQPVEPRWTLPGGGVEIDETVEQAAIREVREETGYDIELGPLLGVHSYLIPAERRRRGGGRAMKAVRVLFEAYVVGGELAQEIDGSTDEARWFDLDEVPGLPQVGLVDIGLTQWRRRLSP